VQAGRTAFKAVLRDGLTSGTDLRTETASGVRRFEAADARSRRSVWIGVWSRIPVLGQPAKWLRGATAATVHIAHEASAVIDQVEPQLDTARDPAGRLALLDTMSARFDRLRAAVDAVEIPAPGWFLPPVDAADRELRGELARMRSGLENGAIAARGLHSFLAGPTSYLVLAANNAEMRAGGMVLQVGVLRTLGGRVGTGAFVSTGDLVLKSPVPLPTEIQRLYGWLDPGSEWRNTGSSPNFPAVAPIYADMSRRTLLGKVDGAIQLDVPGLRALLEVVGPVTVGGRSFDASNVERLIMHDLYTKFGTDQIQRRHEFSKLGRATFRALTTRGWDPRVLIKALTKSAAGRHLMLWSNRPLEQEAWRRLGVDGSLERNGLMVTIQNHAGNKLDWFLRPSVDVQEKKLKDGFTRVTLEIHIPNPTPPKESIYVLGDGAIVPPGAYRALVAAYLPGWATNVEITGTPTLLFGQDGRMRVIGGRLDIAAGATVIVRVAFDAPPNARADLLPSGRFRPIKFRVAGRVLDDDSRRSISF